MEAVVRTQIELLRQNSNFLTIRTRARKRFFYLGTPHLYGFFFSRKPLSESKIETPFQLLGTYRPELLRCAARREEKVRTALIAGLVEPCAVRAVILVAKKIRTASCGTRG